jgi:hypothetical protein
MKDTSVRLNNEVVNRVKRFVTQHNKEKLDNPVMEDFLKSRIIKGRLSVKDFFEAAAVSLLNKMI